MTFPFRRTCGRILFVVWTLTTIVILAGCKPSGERVKIGYMICNSREETLQRFQPVTEYLSRKTGVDFETVPVDTHEFEERYRKGEFAFTHTNSLLYVILKEKIGIEILAADRRGAFGVRTAGAIIARKDSGIRTLADIRGKRMVFGPMLAPTGYLAEYDLLMRSGINPEKDLAYYAIPAGSFKHEKLIYGVLFGKFDVAAAPMLDLEIMTREGKIAADDFVILAQTPLIPYCTFGVSPKADSGLREKVRQALLDLKPEDTVEVSGERVKVLKSAWLDGFDVVADRDYDIIREMAKRVNVAPYQRY